MYVCTYTYTHICVLYVYVSYMFNYATNIYAYSLLHDMT